MPSTVGTHIPSQRVSPVTTPASLTQPGARATGSCPSCGSGRLTRLAMTLTDGTPVQFASCHDCEHRTWIHDGVELAFDDVITRTTKPKA